VSSPGVLQPSSWIPKVPTKTFLSIDGCKIIAAGEGYERGLPISSCWCHNPINVSSVTFTYLKTTPNDAIHFTFNY
jgi:hypothetical protein